MNAPAKPKITLTPCESSRIAAHGHCPETNTLALQFKGKDGKPGPVYQYAGFDPDAYKELQEAESVGKFFGARVNVKNEDGSLKYPFTRLESEKDEQA